MLLQKCPFTRQTAVKFPIFFHYWSWPSSSLFQIMRRGSAVELEEKSSGWVAGEGKSKCQFLGREMLNLFLSAPLIVRLRFDVVNVPKRRGPWCLQQRGVIQDHVFEFSVCRCVCGRNSVRARYVTVLVYLCITFSLCERVNLTLFELSSVCACIVRTSTHQHTYVRTYAHV